MDNPPVCARCGQHNGPSARFCSGCGDGLERPSEASCAACGVILPQGSRYCAGCGQAAIPPVKPSPLPAQKPLLQRLILSVARIGAATAAVIVVSVLLLVWASSAGRQHSNGTPTGPATSPTVVERNLTPEEIATEVRPRTVKIVCEHEVKGTLWNDQNGMFGSGVVIGKDGSTLKILTNLHVLGISEILNSPFWGGPPEVVRYGLKVRFADGETVPVTQAVLNSLLKDFAVLTVTKSRSAPEPLAWAAQMPGQGSKVFAMGHPNGLDFTFTEGLVSAVRDWLSPKGSHYTVIQTDTAINHGNSGGPLVDEHGRLVGINTSGLRDSGAQGLNFAISCQAVASANKAEGWTTLPLVPAQLGPFLYGLVKGATAR